MMMADAIRITTTDRDELTAGTDDDLRAMANRYTVNNAINP